MPRLDRPFAARPRRAPLRASCLRLLASLLLMLLGGADDLWAEEAAYDLEPLPSPRLFLNAPEQTFDPGLAREVAETIERTFASLGDVERGRAVLVERFGRMSAPALTEVLHRANNVTQLWNACLTVAALRDQEGASLDLLPCLRPLQRILESPSDEFHSRAFAALALGCFHWPESEATVLRRPYEALPGPSGLRAAAARTLTESVPRIAARAAEKQAFLRVAAMLALAKRGGTDARAALFDRPLPPLTSAEPRQALLVAGALLEAPDAGPYLAALVDEDRRVRAAGALALAVGMLIEAPPAWSDDVAPLLSALTGPSVLLDKDEGAEAVFARGVCAHRHQLDDQWRQLARLAIQPRSEQRVALAAAQALLFCDHPWFDAEAVQWSAEPRVTLKDPVLALALLRAGQQGTEEAIDSCDRWLRNKSRRPVPTRTWDPRWYAAVGLLRALHHGRIKVRASRARVIDSLRYAVGKGRVLDRKAPLRDALEIVLDAHGRKIAEADETSLYHLPLSALRRVETSFECPYGLLSRDLVDACVRRVNDMVTLMFGLDGIKASTADKPNVEKQPEKYLKRYLDHYPYFSRLEFRTRRGARPPPALDADSDRVIDR